MAWLYRYESKGIQLYILSTRKLTEMIGASSLVEDLQQRTRDRARDCGGEILMAAAGAATIEFPDDDALRGFAGDWLLELDRSVPGLTVVQAWVDRETKGLEELNDRLAAERNRPLVDLPEAGPLVARAGRTGRPAVRKGKRDGLQDRATAAKSKAHGDAQDTLARKLGIEREVARDMEHFGEGYVAVIHADGNGVGGRIIDKIAPLGDDAWKAFSDALEAVTVAAAMRAVATLSGLVPDRGPFPFRPLVLGGDDLTVIVQAQHALAFTACYLEAFEQEAEQRSDALGGPLQACAGIALVKPGFPFHAAHRLAEELCQHGKVGLATAGGPTPSGMTWHRITTPMFESLETVLRDELAVATQHRAQATGGLLGGPWTLARLDKGRRLAEVMRTLPRGTIRQWLRLVRIDRPRADRAWQRMRQVLEPDRRTQLDQALAALDVDPQTGFEGDRTPLLDLATWSNIAGKEKLLWKEARP